MMYTPDGNSVGARLQSIDSVPPLGQPRLIGVA
jgi:hypothetical protein